MKCAVGLSRVPPKGGWAGVAGSLSVLPCCQSVWALRVVIATDTLASLTAWCVCLLGGIHGDNLILAFNHKVNVGWPWGNLCSYNAVCCQLPDTGGDGASGRGPKVGALIVWGPPCLLTDRRIFACCQQQEAPADRKLLLSQCLIRCLTAFGRRSLSSLEFGKEWYDSIKQMMMLICSWKGVGLVWFSLVGFF